MERKRLVQGEELLLKWAKRERLFELLFTENDNPELIKKASEFAKQLHISDKLPKDILFLIWDSRLGKH